MYMKFIVRRASVWDDETSLCEEAKRDSIVRVETRTLHTPEEFDAKFANWEGKWYSVGTNHRVDKNGWITRDNGVINVYSIKINTLNELIKFCEEYGDVVISDCVWNKAYKEILIYDDYIE